MINFPQFVFYSAADAVTHSVDPDQTAPVSALLAQISLSQYFEFYGFQ